MRALWTLAAGMVLAGSAAFAAPDTPPPPYNEFKEIRAHPTPAEQKDFLAYLLRNWDYPPDEGRYQAACATVFEEMKTDPQLAFLTPDDFNATQKPQAIRDIETQCPNIHIGMHWTDMGSDPTIRPVDEPVTEEDLTAIYGEPSRAQKDFALFKIRVGKHQVRPVFYADSGRWLELIDAKQCKKEEMDGGPAPDNTMRGRGIMNGFFSVKSGTYYVSAVRGDGPGIRVTRIPVNLSVKPIDSYRVVRCGFFGSSEHRR